MKKFFRLFFLSLFIFNWIPQGGASIHYPNLEKVLAGINKELPASAMEIQSNSVPSSMCGVKAVIQKADASSLGFKNLSFDGINALQSLFSFLLHVFIDSQLHYFKHPFYSLVLSRPIILPPPRFPASH